MIPLGNIPWKLIGAGAVVLAILLAGGKLYAIGKANAKLEAELLQKEAAIEVYKENQRVLEEAIDRAMASKDELEQIGNDWRTWFAEQMEKPPRIHVVREKVEVPVVEHLPCEDAVVSAFDYLQELKP